MLKVQLPNLCDSLWLVRTWSPASHSKLLLLDGEIDGLFQMYMYTWTYVSGEVPQQMEPEASVIL